MSLHMFSCIISYPGRAENPDRMLAIMLAPCDPMLQVSAIQAQEASQSPSDNILHAFIKIPNPKSHNAEIWDATNMKHDYCVCEDQCIESW